MTEIGDAEFKIYDEWGCGVPITDSMESVVVSGMAVMSLMAILKDIFEEVLR